MTYYDTLSSGDYITAFLELICLPPSLFLFTFPFLPTASKAKVTKHCSGKAVCQTPLFSESKGPCSAHGQVPPCTQSFALWDRGKSWTPNPFPETNSCRGRSASSSLPPSSGSSGQKLWYRFMCKLLCHLSYSGVFGSLSLLVWVLRYLTRVSSNCCPCPQWEGQMCCCLYLHETCRNSIPLRLLPPCQIWHKLATLRELWRGKWTSKHTMWLHKIISTGITYVRLKSEEDLEFSSKDGKVSCSSSAIASVIQ